MSRSSRSKGSQAPNRALRTTPEQKRMLLDFMKAHHQFATGRINAVNGNLIRTRLSEQLTNLLNSCANGANKTTDKWTKAWADWRSDTKAKARRISQYRKETGGGPPPPPLSVLEDELLQFLGPEAVDGLDVPDTLDEVIQDQDQDQHQNSSSVASTSRDNNDPLFSIYSLRSLTPSPVLNQRSCNSQRTHSLNSSRSRSRSPNRPITVTVIEDIAPTPARGGSDRDPMLNAMRRQAEAQEGQAAAMRLQAEALQALVQVMASMATALQLLATNMSRTQ